MRELFFSLADMLEIFLNVLEFGALLISGVTFLFLMFNQYSKALRQIFRPCGLGVRQRLRILFLCRKTAIKKRAFLEYAMLMTQGHAVIAPEWHTIINSFKSYYAASEENLVFSTPNCTLLIKPEFSAVVERYFDFFRDEKARRAFGIRDEVIGWVTKVRIEEAYTTPTCLLSGLLSTYEENWTEFIDRYVSSAHLAETAQEKNTAILTNELYLTFAWLLWGPSYELNYRRYWAGLCQISYGDESNSIPAVAARDSAIAPQLVQQFTDDRGYGALMSLTLTLFDKKPFYQGLGSIVNPDDQYFYDKITEDETAFAAQIDAAIPYEGYRAEKYYCTAYVWLLFELEQPDDYSFQPENTVAFFEHANLADNETYRFLTGTLIDKSVRHFETIFSRPDCAGRRYRFVCAMNDVIAQAFLERYRQIQEEQTPRGEQFRTRILLEPKRTPVDAFAAFDAFFAQHSCFTYEQVSLQDKQSVSDLARFYAEVYIECFPDPDERETFDNLLHYLKAGETATAYRYHILLVKDEQDEILGGAIFDYFRDANSGMVEFIAIKPGSQSAGLGTELYRRVRAMLEEDAFQCAGKQPGWLFCELDAPEHSQAQVKKYLHFWTKQKYRRIGFDYVQPALSAQQAPVTGLWLAAAALEGRPEQVPAALVMQVVAAYMQFCMGIGEPEANREYRQMRDGVAGQAALPLLPILPEP